MTCIEDGREEKLAGTYMGESARTAYDRGLEHCVAMETYNPENPLVEHCEDTHKGTDPNFRMEVLSYEKSNLLRQTREAAKIQMMEGLNLLNRRGEWGQNLPPKLQLEGEEDTKPGEKRKKRADVAPRNLNQEEPDQTSAELDITNTQKKKRSRVESKKAGPQGKPTLAQPSSSQKSMRSMLIALTRGARDKEDQITQLTSEEASEEVQLPRPEFRRSEDEPLIGVEDQSRRWTEE